MMTGIVDEAPDNRNQAYHHLVLNTPGMTSNLHMSFDDVTIGADASVSWYFEPQRLPAIRAVRRSVDNGSPPRLRGET